MGPVGFSPPKFQGPGNAVPSPYPDSHGWALVRRQNCDPEYFIVVSSATETLTSFLINGLAARMGSLTPQLPAALSGRRNDRYFYSDQVVDNVRFYRNIT